MTTKVKAGSFYAEWAGHPLPSLAAIHAVLLETHTSTPIVFLAGDSSLDNKAWIPSQLPSRITGPSIYSTFLEPPGRPKPDIAFWLNHFLGTRAIALNTAVEASTLSDRATDLLPHDAFIRDHICPQDILVVSIGANDIALRPTAATIWNVLRLAWLTSRSAIEAGIAGPLRYFERLFHDQTRSYIDRLVVKQKPRAVILCMIYFPLEAGAGAQSSWAEPHLKLMGYNRDPRQLQTAIRKLYERATSRVEVEGTKVVPCAFYEVLDGKEEGDYVARVEPSVEGGRKMGELLSGVLERLLEVRV